MNGNFRKGQKVKLWPTLSIFKFESYVSDTRKWAYVRDLSGKRLYCVESMLLTEEPKRE